MEGREDPDRGMQPQPLTQVKYDIATHLQNMGCIFFLREKHGLYWGFHPLFVLAYQFPWLEVCYWPFSNNISLSINYYT